MLLTSEIPKGAVAARLWIEHARASRMALPHKGVAWIRVSVNDTIQVDGVRVPATGGTTYQVDVLEDILWQNAGVLELQIELVRATTTYRILKVEVRFGTAKQPLR